MTIASSQLKSFSGTNQHHRHPFGILYTDGVKWLADNAHCYWLIDAIASHQHQCQNDEMLQEIQFWQLEIKGEVAKLVCSRDTDDPVFHQDFEYTDIAEYLEPGLNLIKLYFTGGVLLLQSEY